MGGADYIAIQLQTGVAIVVDHLRRLSKRYGSVDTAQSHRRTSVTI